MARKYSELCEKMSPERQQRNRERATALLVAMNLGKLREHLDITQEDLADRLEISQSNVSRMQKRRDSDAPC